MNWDNEINQVNGNYTVPIQHPTINVIVGVVSAAPKNRAPNEYAATGGIGRKLRDSQVIEARKKMKSGKATLNMLCKEYGVKRNAMAKAIRGITFHHLPGSTTIPRGRVFIPPEVVASIRLDCSSGMCFRNAEIKYGYSYTTIRSIVNRLGKYEHF